MGKKKKQKPPTKARARFSNRPFAGVVLYTNNDAVSPPVELAEKSGVTDPEQQEQGDDATGLEEMLADVTPLEEGPVRSARVLQARELLLEMDDSEAVMRHLDDLIHGDSEFDIAETQEYIEAAVQGLDRRIVKRLRRGEFSVEGHIDLHGMRRDEARLAVARFIEKSHKSSKRCVLIVHGRGLGSKDNIPVLKEKLRAWLTRGAMGKKVLAYSSARPYDGGTGAVYVLLRG